MHNVFTRRESRTMYVPPHRRLEAGAELPGTHIKDDTRADAERIMERRIKEQEIMLMRMIREAEMIELQKQLMQTNNHVPYYYYY
jgi:hypothetical protein